MPMYRWACRHCKQEVEVVRTFADYETPPSSVDGEAGACPTPDQPHDWERLIGGKQSVIKGYGWGSKGNW